MKIDMDKVLAVACEHMSYDNDLRWSVGATPALKIKHLESFAPSMYFALIDALALLKDGDAEPEDADALTGKIELILKNIKGA